MSDFLLELRSEEIPARMQAKARNDLMMAFAEELSRAGLNTGKIETHSTPRRLVLTAQDVAEKTEASQEEVKGPRTSAPPQALDGFLKKHALHRENLIERDGVYFAIIEYPGRSASEILADAVTRILADFPWPKSMRWGSGSDRWVRPLQGVVAMLGDKIVPISFGSVTSGATTVGHRFHHPGAITIGGASDYVEKLRACHVIVDQDERERIIRDGAAKAAKDAGLALVEDEGLVVENAGLTEWPVPLLGRFDADYLDVPREVIVLTMRTNQKYFACTGEDGALAPAFVCVANIDANDGGKAIVEGNKRVLAARLADARFFWEQDLKVPLEEQAKKLGGIVFHEKLGTVADKVERVAKLARWLVEQRIVIPAQAGTQPNKEKLGSRFRGNDEEVAALADLVERAARLAKADLVTGMVGEFPELQGVIGGYLAEAQGEPKAVADAIRDHYGNASEPAGVAVALADKLDTIVGFFVIDEQPTGSKDPFAVRRAALGAIALIVEGKIRLSLVSALMNVVSLYVETAVNWGTRTNALSKDLVANVQSWTRLRNLATQAGVFEGLPPRPEVDLSEFLGLKALMEGLLFSSAENAYAKLAEIMNFFAERLRVQQRDVGVRHDLINAVYTLNTDDDLVRLLARVKALQDFVETGEGRDLLAGYKRASNILKKEEGSWTPDQVRGDDIPAEEVALVSALDTAEPKAAKAVETEDFTAAMSALASLRSPIDAFFDKVTVNDADKGIRARRLSLLARFRDAVHAVADFSKIEG